MSFDLESSQEIVQELLSSSNADQTRSPADLAPPLSCCLEDGRLFKKDMLAVSYFGNWILIIPPV